jgi:hypothetical protein
MILPIFLPFLYAETHYRFKYFFSFLKKAEPEIIADLPHRIEIGNKLPILIIVKDAHKYPVKLNQAQILIDKKQAASLSISKKINSPYYEQIILIENGSFAKGNHLINIKIEYEVNGKIFICYNDNYRGASHKPLPCYFSDSGLPCFKNYVYGETHAHTNFTSDQLEFGASVEKTAELAKSIGLHFYCATDHSYDMDDLPDNYLLNDPKLLKWQIFQKKVSEYNIKNNDFCIIPGEEVSILNQKRENVHLLIYNSQKFYKGSGDSGEKWFHFKSEHDLPSILNDINDKALAFAAHPAEPVPFLQKLLLNRGRWRFKDALHPLLKGVQIINGGNEASVKRGLQYWIKLLLVGMKRFALAGNDAHGNFARYRQISFPFFTLREHYLQIFGSWKTGVFLKDNQLSVGRLIDTLRSGNYFMTNGPAIKITAFSDNKIFEMGSFAENAGSVRVLAESSDEFGSLAYLKVYIGQIGADNEILFDEQHSFKSAYSLEKNLSLADKEGKFYLRAEIKSQNERGVFRAYTNPIWIERHK